MNGPGIAWRHVSTLEVRKITPRLTDTLRLFLERTTPEVLPMEFSKDFRHLIPELLANPVAARLKRVYLKGKYQSICSPKLDKLLAHVMEKKIEEEQPQPRGQFRVEFVPPC